MGKKRGNHEGSITKRTDGRWEAKLLLPNGKRRSFYGKTRTAVLDKLDKARLDLKNGVMPSEGHQTVEEYLMYWLEVRRKTKRIRGSSAYRYQSYIKRIQPFLGRLHLIKLTAHHVQRMMLSLLDDGLAPRTVGFIRTMLRAALKDAVRWELVPRNITDAVDAPGVEDKEMQVLNEEQAKALRAGAKGDDYEALYALVLSTGMRAGEVFALRWQDIDLEQKTIQVQVAWHRAKGDYQLAMPKTSRSRRVIAISAPVVTLLRQHQEAQRKRKETLGTAWDREHDLVFPNEWGKHVNIDKFGKRHFKPLLKRLGLPLIRFHDLRHTAATILLSRGVNVKVVSEMLGHASVTTTLRIYAHVLPHMQGQAAAVMEELLGDG